jgi:hypothetical protein
MNLTEWRKSREGEIFVLQYGESRLELKLRPVSVFDLASKGEIPAPLASVVDEWIGTKSITLTASTFKKYEGVVDMVVKAAAVEPRIDDEPADDAIGLGELDAMEKIAIFNWALTPAAAVLPFPAKPSGDADAARNGDGVRAKAVKSARVSGR